MTWGPNAFNLKTQILAGVDDPDPLYLHHYETYHVMQTQLARGEQRDVIEDLYSVLAHTSATHAGFETTIRPWADRDPGGNRPPHGWFAGRTIELLRNLFVREEGDSLHLLSAISPAWVVLGQSIGVRRCSTDFGNLDLSLECRPDGATLTIAPNWRVRPKRLVLHWPWFVKPVSAESGGRKLTIRDGVTVLPADARTVRLRWRVLPTGTLNYEAAVRIWLEKNYRPRPDEDRMFLFPRPVAPRMTGSLRTFVGSAEVRWTNPSGKGEVRFTTDGSEPTPRSRRGDLPLRIGRTTTLKAAVFWPDGRRSPITLVRMERVRPKEPDFPRVAGRGLRACLYSGTFERLPDFARLQPSATATVALPTLDLPGRPDDGFALRFEGAFFADRDGVYAFALGSDDGSRLEIGGRLVIDNDGLHAYRELRGEIALKRGWHRFAVSVFDAGSVEYLRLFQIAPDGSKVTVPAERYGLPPES
ncbi:MAG: PA14 domain-containing protein, partial [Fimbriimonadales bacterium]